MQPFDEGMESSNVRPEALGVGNVRGAIVRRRLKLLVLPFQRGMFGS